MKVKLNELEVGEGNRQGTLQLPDGRGRGGGGYMYVMNGVALMRQSVFSLQLIP
jgi:hypothetical protein